VKRLCLLVLLTAAPAAWSEPVPHAGCFELASRRYQIDLGLLLAVASVESNWNADARSDMNAHGIMQIRWPLTARHLGAVRVAELYNPCFNIDLGAQYLRELHDAYGQDYVLALAAYNYGPARIRARADIPPGVERYVRKVLQRREELNRRMEAAAPLAPGGIIEVSRFSEPSRARAFMRSLIARVPDARFRLEIEDGDGIVLVERASLTPSARYRLQALWPDLME